MPHNLCYEFGPYNLNLEKRVLTCADETISLAAENNFGFLLSSLGSFEAAEQHLRLLGNTQQTGLQVRVQKCIDQVEL